MREEKVSNVEEYLSSISDEKFKELREELMKSSEVIKTPHGNVIKIVHPNLKLNDES